MMKPTKNEHKPTEGIRSLDSTTIFRVANFELYAKPNKYVMGLGLMAITGCVGYLYYMNQSHKNDIASSNYIATSEEDLPIIRKRSSRWN